MSLSARCCPVDSAAEWCNYHGVKPQQQGRCWGMYAMCDPQRTHCKPTFPVMEIWTEQIETEVTHVYMCYVHSIVAENICFSFRGRSKNWWRRPLKILVAPGKRLLSLNPETSYRPRQIAPPGFTNGSSRFPMKSLVLCLILWERWWPISESRLR